ncbi:DNA mismatch repair protein MutL [Blastopirellula marina]|uniref:DNA mismatch repair protein MutL n=1 Tax=Blastopirellula marina TaxID=124 RepID=A0A2S8FAH0_9BACT|nr:MULTISPECIES: DNA mismatch repair endonuclease MutL [Pirellulaceae]PQO29155.1 DNA mismatch repair protein MutL [Blastopirellula marina]RCS50348.1 DNA mismatch repair endonuclease MutL [Bremerella cremea]
MPKIQQLSASVVNKIAAGEVIERPASAVKELMENSLDAGATRIDVTIEHGGTELIRIADNGCGIAPEDMALTIASHATSKIGNADDLFHVRTLGFRGEALASISEVSHFLLRSRTHDSDCGSEMLVHGGNVQEAQPCGCPPGTIIEIRNLFYNTPVRKKFLKTTQTEFGHISESFTRMALAYPHVHFTLKHGTRLVHDLPPCQDLRERIRVFFGEEIADQLIEVESENDQVTLLGYVGNPRFSRSNNRMQYLFLNGRFIKDRALQHALGEAYRGLLLHGRFPISFLRMTMPPEMVDVNVHPTKLEVRFQDSGRIYSQLLGTLRTKFLSSNLDATYRPSAEDASNGHGDSPSAEALREELVAWAKGAVDNGSTSSSERRQTDFDLDFRSPNRSPLQLNPIDRSAVGAGSLPLPPIPSGITPAHLRDQEDVEEEALEPMPAATLGGGVGSQQRAIQLHNRYLIAETDEGMAVIDQHALHERILYEELREKALARRLEVQRMLVPETLNLSAQEFAAVDAATETLKQVGIEVEAFGGDTILIRSYPAILGRRKPAEIVREVVDQLLTEGKNLEKRDLLDELLHMMSCKAAIKAGDRLSSEEIDALLELRHLCQDAHHCPHGRPTALVFTKEELDRRFQRT